MQRRTVLQILAAFFASFFGKFRRLGELVPIARLRGIPTGPRGTVSLKAAWFSPPTYGLVQTHSLEHHTEMVESLRAGATLPPPTLPLLKKDEFRPFIFKADPGYVPERQEGYEVMVLKNSAVQPSVVMGMSFPNGRPEGYVTPTGPIARAGGAWTPLKTFLPLKPHPELPAGFILVGTMMNPATPPRVDISNDTEFRAITGKRNWQGKLGTLTDKDLDPPSEEELQRQADVQAKIDANYQELLDNWGKPFDQADIDRAHEAVAPAIEEHSQRHWARQTFPPLLKS